MKQVRLYGPDDLRMDDMPDPLPGSADVVVKVNAFGICGSDLHFKKRGGITDVVKQPCGIGHEFIGTIHRVGEAVSKLKPGMRVVVDPIENGNAIGIGAAEGAYAEYVLVKKARLGDAIHLLPDALSFDRAVLTEPIAVATHAINRGEFPVGGRAVVFGTGPIGLAAIAVLKYRRASRIVAVDIVEERLQRALSLGASDVINPARVANLREALMDTVGRGHDHRLPFADADIFIDAAGAPGILNDAANVARPRGRSKIVVVAVSGKPESIDSNLFLSRELDIRGTMCYPNEFPEVIAMLADPEFNIEPMISHHFRFENFHEAFKTAENPRLSAKVVVHVE